MATLYTYPSAMTCHWFTTISSKSTTKLDTRLLKLLLQYLAVWKSESLSRMLPHGPELVVSTSLIKFCQNDWYNLDACMVENRIQIDCGIVVVVWIFHLIWLQRQGGLKQYFMAIVKSDLSMKHYLKRNPIELLWSTPSIHWTLE